MRILSENETALLIGDMSKINLPDGVELYLSLGVAQIYQRISNIAQTDEKGWLYLPLHLIDTIIQNKSNVPSDSLDYFNNIEPLSCGDNFIFPLCIDQKIDIILVSKNNTLDSVDKATLRYLVSTYDVYKEKNQKYGDSHDLFLKTFAENNDSTISFMKSILNLIVKEIPGSCAGYYSDEQDGLYRRMIVGDLEKFDLIPSFVDNDVKSDWEDCIKRNTHFIPANKLSNEVQFLVHPPDFIFVYDGLRSDCSDNFISILIPNNVDMAVIEFIKTIITMIGKLSETQFIKSATVMEYYKNHLLNKNSKCSSLELLESMFTFLNKQLRISRLLFFEDDKTTVISFSRDGVYKASDKLSMRLSEQVQQSIQTGNGWLLTDSTDENRYDNQNDSSQSNIQSELLYQVSLPDGKDGYIVVGTSQSVGVLETYLPFIIDVIEAFENCYSCLLNKLFIEKLRDRTEILKSRINQIDKLSSGYFQQVFSKMTVLLGKTEQLKSHLTNDIYKDQFLTLSNLLSAIEENADLAGEFVAKLNSIIPHNNEYDLRNINSDNMMKEIPSLLEGYLYQTTVTRKISLRIDNLTQINSGFLISRREIDDVVLPIILSLIDEAVKDGTLAIAADRELGVEYITLSFHKSLIADKDIASVIFNLFKDYSIQPGEDKMFVFDNLKISTIIKSDNMITVKIQFLQESITVNKSNNGIYKGKLASV